ncbi:MAG: hypothetical protein WC989_01050 [Micavibrio sp.]
MKFKALILAAALLFPTAAQADYFVWKHEKTGLSVTFPDGWRMQNSTGVNTILTIAGPSYNEQPVCKIDAVPDRRFTIYPAHYGEAVQKVAVSVPFWRQYLAQYDRYNLGHVYDGVGLGRWFASYAVASYSRHFGTVMQNRSAVMYASLYRDTLYVVECSALDHGYDRWADNFRGIIKSIDFKKAYHELPTGDYANFLDEAETFFWAQTGPDGTTAY